MDELTTVKNHIYQALHNLTDTGDVTQIYAEDALFYASHPFNEMQGHKSILAFWASLRTAFPDIERRDSIFVAGYAKPDSRTPQHEEGRCLVASMGTYQGRFQSEFCGIAPTGGVVHLRFCEVHHVEADKIVHSYVMLDILDLLHQLGKWPLVPSLGYEGMWPGPKTSDGLRLDDTDSVAGDAGFKLVIDMHNELGNYDGNSLDSMDMQAFWTKNFMWYGPSGIGTTRALQGFRAHHQIPFLRAFPDRQGAGHYIRIAEANYVVTGGWPSVTGRHLGEFLGVAPSGQKIDMRVMDFYRIEGDHIAENWVPIDILHMLMQMGVDVLGRLAHRNGAFPTDI